MKKIFRQYYLNHIDYAISQVKKFFSTDVEKLIGTDETEDSKRENWGQIFRNCLNYCGIVISDYEKIFQGRFKKQGINGYFRKNPDKGRGVLVFKQRIPFMKPVIMDQFMNTSLQHFFR